jgi:hypothetical protein
LLAIGWRYLFPFEELMDMNPAHMVVEVGDGGRAAHEVAILTTGKHVPRLVRVVGWIDTVYAVGFLGTAVHTRRE